jgi:hypothetical protein
MDGRGCSQPSLRITAGLISRRRCGGGGQCNHDDRAHLPDRSLALKSVAMLWSRLTDEAPVFELNFEDRGARTPGSTVS